MKGIFITFEGTEGSGKTTQMNKLVAYLKEKDMSFICTREPGGTKIADKIRDILINPEHKKMTVYTELFLYSASRNQHVEELIIPAIHEGKIVICDRFADSMVAYQCFGREISRKLIDNFNRMSTHGIKPDLTFLIEVPVEVGLKRARNLKKEFSEGVGKGDRLEQEDLDFHLRVSKGYKKIAYRNPKRVIVIDGNRTEKEVFENIKIELEKKFKERSDLQKSGLWEKRRSI